MKKLLVLCIMGFCVYAGPTQETEKTEHYLSKDQQLRLFLIKQLERVDQRLNELESRITALELQD